MAEKHRENTLLSFVLYYSLLSLASLFVCFSVHQTIVDSKLRYQLREQSCCSFSPSCCWRLLSALKLHYIFRVAVWHVILESCTAALVLLVTDLCFLHSGWPPWAAGCWQIAVGWQIRSSAPLICPVGPLCLTAFFCHSHWAQQMIGDSVVPAKLFCCNCGFLDGCCASLYAFHDHFFHFHYFCAGDQNWLCSSSHQR